MLTTAAILAVAAGDDANAAGTAAAGNLVADLLSNFGVSLPTFIAALINFALVAGVLYFFAIRPVLKTLDERNAKIADGLRYAEEMKAKLDDAERQHSERLDAAAAEAAGTLRDAADRAKAITEQAERDAAARASEILERARAQVAQEHDRLLAELRSEVAKLVVETTAKVLATDLTDADRARFNSAALSALTK